MTLPTDPEYEARRTRANTLPDGRRLIGQRYWTYEPVYEGDNVTEGYMELHNEEEF